MAFVIDPERRYTARQAAVFLGVNLPVVRRWFAKGELPATKAADGRWRIGGAAILGTLAAAETERRERARRPGAPAVDPAAWYGTREAASVLGILPAAVQARLRRGRLPATKTGDGWRIRGADLLAAGERADGGGG